MKRVVQVVSDDDDGDVGTVPIASVSHALSSQGHSLMESPLSPVSPIALEQPVSARAPAALNGASQVGAATHSPDIHSQGGPAANAAQIQTAQQPSEALNAPAATPVTDAADQTGSPHAHPSREQVVQETLDKQAGHSHDKPPSAIAAEGAMTHLPDVNATAPWVVEAAALQSQSLSEQRVSPEDMQPDGRLLHRAPLPTPVRGHSPLPPLDERLAAANAGAASIAKAEEAAEAGVPVQEIVAQVHLPTPVADDAAAPAPAADQDNQGAAASAAAASASAVAAISPSPSPAPSANGLSTGSYSATPSRRPSAVAAARRVEELVRVDRWGNIRRDDDSATPAAGAGAGLSPPSDDPARRRKQLLLDQDRETKWVKMVAAWDRTMKTRSEKMKRRIRKGIPDSMRAAVWPRFTGAWELMKATQPKADGSSSSSPAKVGPGVYERYKGMYSKEQDTIQRDIARTFPNHVLFRDRDPSGDEAGVGANIAQQQQIPGAAGGGVGSAGQGRAKGEDLEGRNSSGRSALYNVLKAYSLHDEQVGYCQGMGFPAGLFLMYMSEEESFWMLHCISRGDKYLLNGLWSPGFPLLFQYFSQFASLLAKHCPKLAHHLASQEQPITPELYATHWFMTLFSYNLPFEVVLRIWDILLAEGPKIVFRLAIFFMQHLESRLLAERDFAAILDLLKNLHREPIMQTPDAVIEGALRVNISRDELSKLAQKYQAAKFHEEQEKQRMAAARKNKQ